MSVQEKMTAIANAIREKTGGTETLTLDQMAEEIKGIKSGAGEWTTDGIIEGTEPSGEITYNGTSVIGYAFYGNKNITSFTAPNATSFARGTFDGCSNLTKLTIPSAKNVSQSFAPYCAVTELDLPSLRGSGMGYGAFTNMTALKTLDIGEACNTVAGTAFSGCTALDTLVLRSPSGMSLTNVNAFNNTPFASGGAGGTIYVPQALIDSGFYTTATNWSVIDGYGTITWKSVEGSEYE